MDAYTINEAARATGLSPREVRVRIEEGDLRAFIRAGRRMVEQSELERLIELSMPATPALRAAPPPAASPRAVQDMVARLEEQALELARIRRTAAETRARDAADVRKLEQELGDVRRQLTRARERIAQLESEGAQAPVVVDQRSALTPLFRRTEPEPN